MIDERGNRTFGAGDGELDGASARRLIAAGLNGHKARPVVDLRDAAAICFLLAFAVAVVWWLW